jgi:hypothetical protein
MTHHRPANPANTSNFKYLIFKIPISVFSVEIPLDFYSRILGKQHCAFSLLIKRTTDNICGANTPPIEHVGKAVMISNLDCYRGKIFTAEKGVPNSTAVIVGESRSALETDNVTAGNSARR